VVDDLVELECVDLAGVVAGECFADVLDEFRELGRLVPPMVAFAARRAALVLPSLSEVGGLPVVLKLSCTIGQGYRDGRETVPAAAGVGWSMCSAACRVAGDVSAPGCNFPTGLMQIGRSRNR
jgi:hypothetical protein